MFTEAKEKWLAALRSGEYKQANGMLATANVDAFCCLGVLCDVYRKETGIGRWESINDHESGFRIPGFHAAYTALHDEVRKWAGLKSTDPEVMDFEDEPKQLSIVNDIDGRSFTEIADMIEENF